MLSEIIDIRGAFYSGASSVCAFLRGSRELLCFGGWIEFSFLRDKYGLLFLLNSDVFMDGIKDFEANIERYATEFARDCDAYYGYTLTDDDKNKYKLLFMRKALRFLQNVLYWKQKLEPVRNSISRFFPKTRIVSDVFSTASKSLDIFLTKKAISDIFSIIKKRNRLVFLSDIDPALDEPLSVKRRILVLRDIRDSYCSYIKRAQDSLKNGGTKAPGYPYSDEEAYKFLNVNRSVRKRFLPMDCNMLTVHFEDFVLHHEREVDRICNFLDIKKKNIDRSMYDINYSKSRIGLYKSYPNQELMNRIVSEYKDCLYEA